MAGENFFTTNNNPLLAAVSSVDGKAPVYLWADPVTHALAFSASVSIAKDPIPASGITSALSVQILDGSGNQITSFGGGTQYLDAGTPPTHPTGPTLEFNNAGVWATVGTANPLPVSATISTAGLATSVKQSDGSQKTQIVDNSGNVIGATSNALDINIKSGNLTTLPVTNAGTFAVQATLNAETTKVIGVVRNADGAGNLWTSNSTTYTAKFAQDGNLLGTLGTAFTTAGKVDVKGADGDVFVRQATAANLNATVVGTGTFSTQVTSLPALPAGTNVIGHVITDTGSTTAVTGNVTVTQATASNLNATVVGTGTFVVQATLVAETTKVIGTVNQGTSPWVTSNATTSVVGNGTAATAQRVTLANDSTGIIATVGAVTAITNALPVGSNVIGKVSIDQTTPGTTNKVDIADSLNNPVSAFPATFLRMTDEPHQLFYDAFDTAIDTTNRWTVTSGNSGVAATNTAGVMTMGTGTVANGYSKLTSQPSFTLPIPAWLGVSDAIALPDGAAPVSNSYLYWGTGTTPGTPSVATPVTDGYGFERNIDGKLRAVVYAGGTRTVIQDLSTSGNSTQPTDAAYHRYIIYIRTDKAYWYIDGITSAQLVATSNFQSSQVQTLPRLFLTIGNSSPPVSNITLTCTGATTWDTGKNNFQLSDGTFPWRKALIDALGNQNVKQRADNAALTNVAASASSVTLLSANTARIGAQITNDSSSVVYIKFGTTASLTSYTVSLAGAASAPFSYYEVPAGYTGRIDAIWASAAGNARITEES